MTSVHLMFYVLCLKVHIKGSCFSSCNWLYNCCIEFPCGMNGEITRCSSKGNNSVFSNIMDHINSQLYHVFSMSINSSSFSFSFFGLLVKVLNYKTTNIFGYIMDREISPWYNSLHSKYCRLILISMWHTTGHHRDLPMWYGLCLHISNNYF